MNCVTPPARLLSKLFRWTLPFLGACVLAACGGSGDDGVQSTPIQTPIVADAKVWAAAKAMGPGVNFGNMLEAPTEGGWGLSVQTEYIQAAWNAGFRTIRLPVRWSNHSSGVYPYAIDAAFMNRVAAVVDQMLATGFHVVLDMHHHRQLDGDALDSGEYAVAAADLNPRFIAMWSQISTHFANRSSRLMFELYNEPHGNLTASAWNDLLATTLKQVRIASPDRIVLLDASNQGDAFALGTLKLPADPYLMATFHSYTPFDFTHQGADWVTPKLPTGVTCCTAAQSEAMANVVRHASLWSSANGYPVVLGEFGAYSTADMASRAAYTRQMRQFADAVNMPWIYWEFADGFGVYDTASKSFRTELLNALMNR